MKSPFIKWLVLSIVLILTTEIFKKIIHFDDLVYNSLSEQLTSQQVENFLGFQKKWQWVGYIFIPIFLLIKTSIIATIVYIGLFFFNKNFNFKSLWNITLKAEFVFLLVPIFKTIWFYFFQPNYNLQDIQNFYPLCALNIVGYKDLETWFVYPFQTLNLFELAYIIYLGYQIGQLTGTNTDRGLKLVAYSYVPALLLWVVTIMFFTLNYS
ncbi:MAG: hypothetical protein ABIP27_15290 [Flavobacterium circumlabens]|uniref:Yip1 domain-containing protein n=1 Tax=Flavobacterium circumlabens TaxID=2133765 RepID=A0A4Y7UHM9_9FLAO|nr:hypothetical protein [Flavobacterium circumlabens]TCN60826.1 hypothetical protein EV142_101403 [Flavobacterium circumlabens]TEB45960.1 hypothetical protein D0809_02875 [Flavobacterium circumlabens]